MCYRGYKHTKKSLAKMRKARARIAARIAEDRKWERHLGDIYQESVDEDEIRRIADLDGHPPEYYWNLLHTPRIKRILERKGFYEVKNPDGKIIRRFETYY